MTIKTLYRYKRNDGGIDVSLNAPMDRPCTVLVRLIADEGKVLSKGTTVTNCIDTESAEGWTEIDAPSEEEN